MRDTGKVLESAFSLFPLGEAGCSTRLEESLWLVVLGFKMSRVVGSASSF